MHSLKTKEDVQAFVDAVKKSSSTMAEAAETLAKGTPLETQPTPENGQASKEVGPLVWTRIEKRIRKAALDPRNPVAPVASLSTVDGVLQLFRIRYLQGIARYPTALKTHNKRNAYADCIQELVDALFYQIQGEVEDEDVLHRDVALDKAINHTIAALLYMSAVVDADPAGARVGRPPQRIPREAIKAPEQREAPKQRGGGADETLTPEPKVEKEKG